MSKLPVKKLLDKHQELIHSENVKVVSHVQREIDDWWQHTIMIQDCDTPFKFKRKKQYKNLRGASVNLTYYIDAQEVAGIPFEVMKVVRLKRS
jgi:hypothetical protein